MSDVNRKRKQLSSLELLLTFAVVINKMESSESRYSYNGSREHKRSVNVIEAKLKELGLDWDACENDVRKLLCRWMGEPTLLIPDREIDITQKNELWSATRPRRSKITIPRRKPIVFKA